APAAHSRRLPAQLSLRPAWRPASSAAASRASAYLQAEGRQQLRAGLRELHAVCGLREPRVEQLRVAIEVLGSRDDVFTEARLGRAIDLLAERNDSIVEGNRLGETIDRAQVRVGAALDRPGERRFVGRNDLGLNRERVAFAS